MPHMGLGGGLGRRVGAPAPHVVRPPHHHRPEEPPRDGVGPHALGLVGGGLPVLLDRLLIDRRLRRGEESAEGSRAAGRARRGHAPLPRGGEAPSQWRSIASRSVLGRKGRGTHPRDKGLGRRICPLKGDGPGRLGRLGEAMSVPLPISVVRGGRACDAHGDEQSLGKHGPWVLGCQDRNRCCDVSRRLLL